MEPNIHKKAFLESLLIDKEILKPKEDNTIVAMIDIEDFITTLMLINNMLITKTANNPNATFHQFSTLFDI